MRMKRRSLLVKVAVVSLIMAVLAVILGSLILFEVFRQRAVKNMEEKLTSTITVCSFQIYDYYTYMWLMDFWKEHGTEMEAPPFGGDQERLTAWVNKTAYLFDTVPSRISLEEVEAMSFEEQKEFAEFCYTELYRSFTNYRDIFDIDRISLFVPEEDEKTAYRFFGVDKKDEGKNTLDLERILGTVVPFDPEQHPEMQKVMGQETFTSEIEFYRSPEDGSEYAAIYDPVGANGEIKGIFSLTQSMDRLLSEVWADVLSFEKWIVLIIIIAILILLLTLYLSSIRPTLVLQKRIRAYKQNKNREELTTSLSDLIRRSDEIGRLSDDVNDMACEIERYYQEIIKLTEAEEQMKSSLLIAQIKPHFIYNSLTAIRSRMDEPEKAEELLNHFAGVLRGCIDVLEETECIRAEREFKTVEDYLFMEKERFGEKLTVVTELSDQDFFLPAFSVQILVENAVNHGVRQNPGGRGTVWIRSCRKDASHIIEVEDDGPGIPEEALEDTDSIHIGLTNVKKRLAMKCGGELVISARPEKGTIAVICIPDPARAEKDAVPE